MSEATRPVLQNDAAATEVELSTEDLLALTNSNTGKSDAVLAFAQSLSTVSANTRPARLHKPPASGNLSGSRMALSLVAVLVLVSAGYGLFAWHKATPSLADIFERKSSLHELRSDAAAQAAAQPVRLTNPFDAKEVFEFSPGTTQDAAREAVAEILLKRAIKRQRS